MLWIDDNIMNNLVNNAVAVVNTANSIAEYYVDSGWEHDADLMYRYSSLGFLDESNEYMKTVLSYFGYEYDEFVDKLILNNAGLVPNANKLYKA